MPHTASDLMMESQIGNQKQDSNIVLPSAAVRDFLLASIDQLNFPGKMVEFVAEVKSMIATASITDFRS